MRLLDIDEKDEDVEATQQDIHEVLQEFFSLLKQATATFVW